MNALAGLSASSGDNNSRANITFREWEERNVASYPLSLRSDVLPEFLAFAFGVVSSNVNGLGTLPELEVSQVGESIYPQFRFNRRIGLNPANYVIRHLGDDLTLWEDNTSFWETMSALPDANGLTEAVTLRRNFEITDEEAAFYSIGVLLD